MFKGVIVENSLSDNNILKKLQIMKSWEEGDWILHSILIEEDKISDLAKHLLDGPWYIHLWKSEKDEINVIFKDKIFLIKASDKTTWKEAIAYGQSIGIPNEQLDFLTN
jgi:hypothetical protein